MFFKTIKAIRLNYKAAPDADKVLECLDIKAGEVVADIGSGGGYFSYRFSEKVGPEGRVYAVDIDSGFLSIVAKGARRRGIRNMEMLRCGPNGGALPEFSCNLVFIRNAFHHLVSPIAYMRNLRSALRPGGRVAVIEWLPASARRNHGTLPESIIETMVKAEFKLVKTYDFLPKQSFTTYTLESKK